MKFEEISKAVRRNIIGMAHRSKCAHVGSALSCVDILTALYFDRLRLEPWSERDIFVLSKAHGAMALYSVLAERGIMPREMLSGYFAENGTLPGHLDRFAAKGIETSGGSLGHGFNIALGMAFGFKKSGSDRQVYTVIGDGESEEGSIWEGALFGSRLGIDNFTVIVDFNNLQGYGRPSEICHYENLRAKWESFGWTCFEVSGHSFEELMAAFATPPAGRPKVIIARTTKGKGISFMEDQLIWHYYIVTDEIWDKALRELQ
jgi:transketolase